MEAGLKGELRNDKVVHYGGLGLGCGVEGSPFNKFLLYALGEENGKEHSKHLTLNTLSAYFR